MEGYNPTAGCTAGCYGCRSGGWVPLRSTYFARRDALIDAVGRMDNPCDRPRRCPPCCSPVPSFRPPQEKPICDINCFRQEQAEAKCKEQWENYYCNCVDGYPLDTCLRVDGLDPGRGMIVNAEPCPDPEQTFNLREQPCKTDIIAGFFNPDDNKTAEQKLRERCDPYWRKCNCDLPPYPCRAAIRYPPQRCVSVAEEQRLCYDCACKGSKYVDPKYVQEQGEKLARIEHEECMRKQAERRFEASEWLKRNADCIIPGCPTGRCGCDYE